MKTKMFQVSQFTPTKFDTAEDKAKFANQFVKFVEGGFEEKDFPKWFYKHLSTNVFGHHAHYDHGGFYGDFFVRAASRIQFVAECINWPCYGEPDITWSDVERALHTWLVTQDVLWKLKEEQASETEKKERGLLRQLAAKYPDEVPKL